MVTRDTRLIDKCDRIFMMEDGVVRKKRIITKSRWKNGPSIQ